MSSLQDFAKLQLNAPGQLGNPPAPTPAPIPYPTPPPTPPPTQPSLVVPDVPMQPVRDVPTPAQIGAGASAVEPNAPNLHSPHAIVNAEQHDERQARIDTDKAAGLQLDAARDNARLEADKAAAMQPILNQHMQNVADNANAQQQNYERLHAVGQKAAADYAVQIQQLGDKMANQPKDMFGRAGVNKVEGIIGLILGGLAGSATGGKNMAVERLNQLTQQKMAQDKYEYEMLGKKADMSQNLYAQLRQGGLDDIAAHNAYSAAQSDALLARIKATENSYVPQKAKNDLLNLQAQILEQKTKAVQAGQQHIYGQSMQAYALEQKDREMQLQREIAELRFDTRKGVEEANPIAADVSFADPHFGKNNKNVMGRMQVQDQALKEAFAQMQQYKNTTMWEPLKRAGLRKGIAGSLATTDVGNPRVSEARVKAAETETGADAAIHLGPIEIGQKGAFSGGIDDRLLQAVRTRAEVYYNSLKAAQGLPVPGSELDHIFKVLKVGDQYGLDESPKSIEGKEKTLRETALDALKAKGN